ncbi:MAG: Wzz/FepE/Etk N-terminal domain-containing protein, partial [Gelidibacter sp.]
MNQERLNSISGKTDQGELIKFLVKKYLRFWFLFVIGVVVALGAAFIYLRYTPNIYNTSAKIQVLNKSKGIEMPSSSFIFNRSTINLENEIEVIKSLRISERVARNLDLTMAFYEEGNIRTTEIAAFPFNLKKTISNDSIKSYQSFKILITEKGFEVYRGASEEPIVFPNYSSFNVSHDLPFELEATSISGIKKSKGKTYIFRLIPVTAAASNVKGNFGVSILGKGSDLLQLSFVGQSKDKSERILNELISVFNMDGIVDRQEVSKRTIAFIDDRFELLAGELDSIEGNKRDYKQNNDFFDVESDAALGITQRTASENEVFAIEGQILLSNMLAESLNVEERQFELLPANIGIASVNTNELINTYNALIFERDNYLTSGGENNPMVQTLSQKLKELAKNINVSLDSYKSQLQASKNQLVKRSNKFSSQVSGIPAKEKIMRSIDRQQVIKETLYLFLLQKREEAGINLAITEPSIKVVEYAISGGAPISPNRKNIYLMAIVAGLLVPFGIIYISMMLDTKVKDKKDVELRVANIPVLAELPKIKTENLVFSDPTDRTTQAEAFRILSSNVNYVLPKLADGKGKVIYMTSTIKGEGKTYAGVNLS